MYLLLLGFGAGLCAAGALLAGAGLSIREGSFDSGLFTPGIVAAVGGFLLIGLGLALRTLQRIEHALAARSVPGVAQEQIAEPVQASDQSGEPDSFAIALQASTASHPAAAVARTRDDPSANGAAEKSPDTARLGNRPLPSLPKAAVPAAAEVNSETDTEHFGRPGNGAAAGRISFQLPTNARPARRLSGRRRRHSIQCGQKLRDPRKPRRRRRRSNASRISSKALTWPPARRSNKRSHKMRPRRTWLHNP